MKEFLLSIIPRDQLAFLVCLLLSFGASFVYWTWLLPLKGYRTVKLAYIFVIGQLFTAVLVLSSGMARQMLYFRPFMNVFHHLFHQQTMSWWNPMTWSWRPWGHIHGPVILTYLIVRRYRTCWWMPQVVLFGLLLHLTILHYLRYLHMYGQYTVDYISIVMILVMKLSSFAFDIYDSTLLREVTKNNKKDDDSKEDISSELNASRLATVRFPDVLEFLAYSFLFTGVLTGPLVCFPEFQSFIDGTYFLTGPSQALLTTMATQAKDDDDQKEQGEKSSLLLSTEDSKVDSKKVLKAAVLSREALISRQRYFWKLMMQSALAIVLYLWSGPYFSTQFLVSKNFGNMPWLQRCLYLHLYNIYIRCRYYVAWGLAEASCVLIGLSFNGIQPQSSHHTSHHHHHRHHHHYSSGSSEDLTDKEIRTQPIQYRWDRLEMVDPWKIELSTNFRDALTAWHRPTNSWLHVYVYKRFGGRKPGRIGVRANLITKLISAWWHGVYPGYYASFVTAALYTWDSKLIYKYWPFSIPGQRLIGAIFHHMILDYLVPLFDMISWTNCMAYLHNQRYWGHIVLLLVVLTVNLGFRSRFPIVTTAAAIVSS